MNLTLINAQHNFKFHNSTWKKMNNNGVSKAIFIWNTDNYRYGFQCRVLFSLDSDENVPLDENPKLIVS